MNLNKAMIIGNLTRDPELRNTPAGVAVASFSVATNQVWNDQNGQKQERVEFHNIVVWRKLAEICGQYLKKGSKIYIEGRLQTRDWVGQDSIKRYRTEIIADNMIMLDRVGAQGGGGQFGANEAPPIAESQDSGANAGFSEPSVGVDNVEEEDIKVENIPF